MIANTAGTVDVAVAIVTEVADTAGIVDVAVKAVPESEDGRSAGIEDVATVAVIAGTAEIAVWPQ